MDSTFPWSQKNDVLFSDSKEWWQNACVGWTRDAWTGYSEGYWRAADLLVQHSLENQSCQDFLVYPVVFLYRQALEVTLKHLLHIGNQLLNRSSAIPMQHQLLPLWQRCRTILEEIWPEGAKGDLDAVESILREFDARDPRSTTFRYPVQKDGSVSLPDSERIDLRNLSEVANRTYAILDACGTGVNELLQSKWESESQH